MISPRTVKEVQTAWRAFCRAVCKAQREHGRPLQAYFGEGQQICDRELLEAWHDKGQTLDRSAQEDVVVIDLPEVDGFHQDGGGW